MIQDLNSSSMVMKMDDDYNDSPTVDKRERLNSLAARENTFIDNPY